MLVAEGDGATEDELIAALEADEGNARLIASVRSGEYALWQRREELLAATPDERLTLEVLLWAVGRILGDLEEHGAEQAAALYEGNDAAVFVASKHRLEARAAQVEPRSAAGKALVAGRRALTPRERFAEIRKALGEARRDGSAVRLAAALAEVESISGTLVSSWLDLFLMEVTQVFARAVDEDEVAAYEPAVRAFVAFGDGAHGALLQLALKRSAGRQLARFTPGVCEGLPDRELAARLAELMA